MKKFLLLFIPLLAFAESDEDMKVRSLKAFDQAAQVFQHPRCLNCHPAGDRPTQGLDMHAHKMNVQRGKKDHGMVAMKCVTCHQNHNNDYSGVPGAPKWALAPKEMAWQGLDKGQLCRTLKDKNRTHMTLDQMIEHNAHDELVAWGWNPGEGREPAPFTQERFGQIFKEWVDTGAHCPP